MMSRTTLPRLFLYITAEYATPQNDFNQVILWDQIIVRGEGK